MNSCGLRFLKRDCTAFSFPIKVRTSVCVLDMCHIFMRFVPLPLVLVAISALPTFHPASIGAFSKAFCKRPNLSSTKVNGSYRKSIQVGGQNLGRLASPFGQGLNTDPRYKRTVGQVEMSLACHQQCTRQELVMSDRKLIYQG